jgi:hypothetical protein
MWIAASVVSLLCVAGLAYALYVERNTEPSHGLEPAHRAATSGGGFTLGIVIGIAAGVVIGSLLATRKRD